MDLNSMQYILWETKEKNIDQKDFCPKKRGKTLEAEKITRTNETPDRKKGKNNVW